MGINGRDGQTAHPTATTDAHGVQESSAAPVGAPESPENSGGRLTTRRSPDPTAVGKEEGAVKGGIGSDLLLRI
jgi:hypothetical protein